ncbi:hypothetical protein [Chelatococcus reniformis]|uniref:Uncharacterized protein n=1 Tax=Chelatococcus reniformis TaxID=1494448 RepID=A0A916U7A2_9HYPH|nr:hypothetical protein [Chelatococcus reniformis]GGC61750.1 hypothetical protein GCM10010994_20450 [Chelatococcus reniformis]
MTTPTTTWTTGIAPDAAPRRRDRSGLTFRAIGIPAVVGALTASAKSAVVRPAAPCGAGYAQDEQADEDRVAGRGAHD